MKTRNGAAVLLVVLCLVSFADAGAQERHPPRQITNDPAQEGFPVWSPDGKTIVFSRIGKDLDPASTGLWRVPREGGEATRLTTVLAEHPSWSPDGNYIVFDADGGSSIKLISATGGAPIRIVPESIPVERGGNPRWSPDGSRIAFREGSNLWVLEVSTGRLAKAFSEADLLPIPSCWSRDGTGIYTVLRAGQSPQTTLWLLPATGEGRRQLTFEKEAIYRYMDLSPDGSLLAFVACEGRECDVWVMPADGGRRIRITSAPGYDDTPRWSPDGGTIAFTSTRSGNFDVWTIDVDLDAVRRELTAPER